MDISTNLKASMKSGMRNVILMPMYFLWSTAILFVFHIAFALTTVAAASSTVTAELEIAGEMSHFVDFHTFIHYNPASCRP